MPLEKPAEETPYREAEGGTGGMDNCQNSDAHTRITVHKLKITHAVHVEKAVVQPDEKSFNASKVVQPPAPFPRSPASGKDAIMFQYQTTRSTAKNES
ncbi:hypothetical protein KM043_016634 [Ampulex compressa]|nr:hypothetical protein KM043_016634 [Ampulex compressa]